MVLLQLEELVGDSEFDCLPNLEQVTGRLLYVRLQECMDSFNPRRSRVAKMGRLVDPRLHELLFEREKPRSLDVANLLKMPRNVFLLELGKALGVDFLRR